MGLHPAFFVVTVIAWVFAALGVVYHDETVRDAGFLVSVLTIAIGLVVESEALQKLRATRAARTKVRAASVKAESGFEALDERAPIAAPAPSTSDVVRPPLSSLPKAAAWEAEFSVPKTPEPIAVAPRANGGASVVAPTTLATSVPSPTERLTRGVCGKCQSPITVSSRRPIRVTCPMCGHSKLLQ